MTLKKKLLIGFCSSIILMGIGLYTLYSSSFDCPQFFVNRLRHIVKIYTNTELDFERLHLSLSNNIIKISKLEVLGIGRVPFLKVDSATLHLSSDNVMRALLKRTVHFAHIDVQGVTINIDAIVKGKTENRLPIILSMPADKITVSKVAISSKLGVFKFDNIKSSFLKKTNEVDFDIVLEKDPFGGHGKVSAKVDLVTGYCRAAVVWQHPGFQNFIPLAMLSRIYGVSIKHGLVDVDLTWNGNLIKRLNYPKKELFKLVASEIMGSIVVSKCDLSWANISTQINAKVNHIASQPWKLNFKAHNKISKLDIQADWLGKENDITKFRGKVEGKSIRLSNEAYRIIGMPLVYTNFGTFSFKGTVEGKEGNVTGVGSASVNGWKVNKKAIDKAEIIWELKRNAIKINGNFKVESGNANLDLSFFPFGKRKGTGKAEGRFVNFDVSVLSGLTSIPMSGKVSGPLLMKFDLNNPENTTYRAGLELDDFYMMSFHPQKIRVRLSGKGKDWVFKDPIAIFKDGSQIACKGTVSADILNLDVMIDKVNLSNFSIPVNIASGPASMIAKITGSIAEPDVVGELWAENCEVMGQNFLSIKSQLKVNRKELLLSPIVFQPAENSMIDGYFALNTITGQVKSFHFNLQALPASIVKSFLPPKYNYLSSEGDISGVVSFNGTTKVDRWEFLLDGHKLSFNDQLVKTIHFEGNIWGNQGEIKHLFARTLGGSINVTGQFLARDKFSGSIEGEAIQLEDALFIQKIFPGIKGEVNLQGDIEWNKGKRTGNITIFAKDLKTKKRSLGNLGGELQIDNKGLKIIKGEFDKLGIQIDGNLSWAKRNPYSAKLNMTNVDLSFIPISHGINGFEAEGLVVDGQCEVRGDIASLTPEIVKLDLTAIKIRKGNDIIVSNKPVEVIFQNKSVEFRSFELKYRMGILGIQGTYKPGANAALTVSGKDFSVKALGNLLDVPDWKYDGKLSLKGSIFGNLPDPTIKSELICNELSIEGRSIPSINAEIEGTAKELNLRKFQVNLPNNYFVLQGKLKLGENFIPKDIDMKCTVPKGPINDFPVYMPDIFRVASGTMNADVQLTGNPYEPVVSGDIMLSADNLSFKGMRHSLKEVKFIVSTENGILKVDTLHAKLGHGTIDGSGKVNFLDANGKIKAHLTGKKIDLSFLNFDLYKTDASVDVTGNLYNPVIHANLMVPRGKLKLSTDMLKEQPKLNLFMKSLKYRIDVEVPRNFWLKSAFLNAEMKGKFAILGDLENMDLEGSIQSVRGRLTFQNRKFKITTGEIRFGGLENKLDPHIFIKSEGQIQNTQVFLTLKGRVSSFTPKLYSSPPMSEGDLLALLTLGRNINEIQNTGTKDLFENEILDGLKSSYISALVGTTISTALNLDELFLTSLYDKTDGRTKQFIRAGKYIGNNMFIAYEGTLNEEEDETYIFEYRLPKGFVVNLEFEKPRDDTRINARYDWKFW